MKRRGRDVAAWVLMWTYCMVCARPQPMLRLLQLNIEWIVSNPDLVSNIMISAAVTAAIGVWSDRFSC